ncbi:MAG: DinB family protein [Nioella sp.]
MITARYVQTMARYNAWQNGQVIAAADTLDEAARRADRGAFFGSIMGTLNHVLWADEMWMHRFAGWPKPKAGISESPALHDDWAALKAARAKADRGMLDWAGRVTDAALSANLAWYSGAIGRDMVRPMALCVAHVFNHQTHHRGQVHAMLTAAGAQPGDTDLALMPEEA